MTLIPFTDFRPDSSPFDGESAHVLRNVIPRKTSYGPFPNIVALSTALAAAPKGAFFAYDSSGTAHIFAGTATNLYKLTAADLTWETVTRTSGGAYSVPADSYWSFAQFGSYVIATYKGLAPQVYELGVSTDFAALSGSPPTGRVVAVIGDQVFFGEDNSQARRLTWSGINQPTFYTARQKLSDFQIFPDGDDITGIVPLETGGLIFQRNAIRSITPALTTPLIHEFQKLETDRGAIAPGSIVQIGREVFFLDKKGFYQFAVPASIPIGSQRVDEFFSMDVNPLYVLLTQGAPDPRTQSVYWRYRSQSSVSTATTDKLLGYHYTVDKWTLVNIELSWIFSAASPGYTLEGLDALGYTMETLPFSLDSPVWSANAPVLGGFTSDYKLGFFTGSPLEAVVQTGSVAIGEGRTFVRGFRPVCDASSVYGRVATKPRHGASATWGSEAQASTTTGMVPTRASGLLHRFEVRIPAGETWKHLHGVEPDAIPEGSR